MREREMPDFSASTYFKHRLNNSSGTMVEERLYIQVRALVASDVQDEYGFSSL